MKTIILSFFCMMAASTMFAQSSKLRVAVAFNTDSSFTVMGPISTKILDINLNDKLFDLIDRRVDIGTFQLTPVKIPEDMSATDNSTVTGIPKMYMMASWLKSLRKKGAYDMVLILYKPVQNAASYTALNGFSYGIVTSKGFVFSLYNALVIDLKNNKFLAGTSIESELDFIAGKFDVDKMMDYNSIKNVQPFVEMINIHHEELALKVAQCLLNAQKKMEQKK